MQATIAIPPSVSAPFPSLLTEINPETDLHSTPEQGSRPGILHIGHRACGRDHVFAPPPSALRHRHKSIQAVPFVQLLAGESHEPLSPHLDPTPRAGMPDPNSYPEWHGRSWCYAPPESSCRRVRGSRLVHQLEEHRHFRAEFIGRVTPPLARVLRGLFRKSGTDEGDDDAPALLAGRSQESALEVNAAAVERRIGHAPCRRGQAPVTVGDGKAHGEQQAVRHRVQTVGPSRQRFSACGDSTEGPRTSRRNCSFTATKTIRPPRSGDLAATPSRCGPPVR